MDPNHSVEIVMNRASGVEFPPMMSPIYTWVRGRQLEGTWPGSQKTGMHLATGMRVMKGWGAIEDSLWPDDGKTWPLVEPDGLDLQAKLHRIGAYQRVNTVEDCRKGIRFYGLVLASFEIDDSWSEAPKGVIQPPKNQPITGVHCICLADYDDHKQRFIFPNSWGANWGRRGLGFLPYSYFPSRFIEGWVVPIPKDRQWSQNSTKIETYKFFTKTGFGNFLYGVEIVDHKINDMVAWGFAVEHEKSLDLEELFVRPNWRRCGYGSLLAAEFSQLGSRLGKRLLAWIPHPDGVKENELALEKIFQRLGLSRSPSPVRWAVAVGESV